MSPSSLFKLVGTLSGPEKRYFKLHSQMQKGNKDYLSLFGSIENATDRDPELVRKEFLKTCPAGSWEQTCTYLGELILDSLVTAKTSKDVFFDLLQQIKEIKILKERSLDEDALKKARKVQQKAARYQIHWVEYYCNRYELGYHADSNFSEINDRDLISLQMKGKDVLRSLNHIHDHYSLYELLKHRLIHAGRIASDDGKKKLNDLMLSEMVLVSGKSKSFNSQKLHLLFQSFFFTDIGEYKSALKSFAELNQLMEKNQEFLDNPPLDYLSALVGILDSLHTLGRVEEVEQFLVRLQNLDRAEYPEYFRYIVKKIYYSQKIFTLLSSGLLAEAIELVETLPKDLFDAYRMIDEEKQCELYFYCALAYFKSRSWKKSHAYLSRIMNSIRLPAQLLISKAIRLLNILVYYEKGEMLHLEYEIRSYKRYFAEARLTKSEKVLFKVLSASAADKRLRLLPKQRTQILSDLQNIQQDRYERQLLKYFELTDWIKALIERGIGKQTPKIA